MHIQNDFREFLKLLSAHDVDFVIVGGYATDPQQHGWRSGEGSG